MNKVELVVFGEPIGKQRPRVSMQHGIVRTYTPEKTQNFENRIIHEYQFKYGKPMFEKGVRLSATVTCYLGLNKGDFGKKGLNKSGREKIDNGFATIKPDLDNVLKSVFDALNGICYFDDSQIGLIVAKKEYTLESPRVEIVIEEIEK